jgi:hypothetical protein
VKGMEEQGRDGTTVRCDLLPSYVDTIPWFTCIKVCFAERFLDYHLISMEMDHARLVTTRLIVRSHPYYYTVTVIDHQGMNLSF